MRPNFSAEQFFDVFRRYHEAVWPAPIGLLIVGGIVLATAVNLPRQSSVIFGGLVALWAWMAIVYHAIFFSSINSLAYVFAAMFVAEAGAIAWHAFHTKQLRLPTTRATAPTAIGAVLIAYSLIGYPVVGYLLGQRYPELPTFGLPCPTTIFTLGVLLWCSRPVPWSVLVIPAIWSIIGASAAVSFGVGEDFALPVAALIAIPLAAHRVRSFPPLATSRR